MALAPSLALKLVAGLAGSRSSTLTARGYSFRRHLNLTLVRRAM